MTIRSEIEGRLTAYAATKNIPVAYENVNFTKPTDGPFLEIVLLDEEAALRNLAAEGKRVFGAFQVNCYAPVGEGMGVLEAIVADVIDTYPVLPKEGTVSIEAPLKRSGKATIDGFVCVPVTGRFRAEF